MCGTMTLAQAEMLAHDLETAEHNVETYRRINPNGNPFSYWFGRLEQLISVDNTIGFLQMVRESKPDNKYRPLRDPNLET